MNRQFLEADVYVGIVCSKKKHIKDIIYKEDYKRLKKKIKRLFKTNKKLVVYDNINSFYGGGVNIDTFDNYKKYKTVKYDKNFNRKGEDNDN